MTPRVRRDGSSQEVEGREVLGIPVARGQLLQWREWLMPAEQPFVMTHAEAAGRGLSSEPERVTQELQGAFMLYGVDDLAVCWLTEQQASTLPLALRRTQPGQHHWPTSEVAADVDDVVAYVVDGMRASRHREIAPARWATIGAFLPNAQRLAGVFPEGSGGNCFATVMAASGVKGAQGVWMQREPFERWLAERTAPLGARDRANDLGVVYVWRRDGLVDHAAVSLGDGYGLHKASAGSMTPTQVLTTDELKTASRAVGRRLQRHRLR